MFVKKIFALICIAVIFSLNITFAAETKNSENASSADTVSLYKNAVNSMVYIETQEGLGSGVIVKADGTLITCFHVIANADYIIVKLNDGSMYNVNGFRYINPVTDVAILTIDSTRRFKPIKIDKNYKMEIGEKIYTISNPQGKQFTFSDGMISQYSKDNIQFTAPISTGSSGGALLNKNGYLLGIITSLMKEAQNVNFALPNEYYISKIENSAIINHDNLKWTDFLVANANEEQVKLYTQYAFNKDQIGIIYKYLKPFGKRYDVPEEYYSMFGFFALYACIYNGNDEYLNDSLYWYEKSYKINPKDEATLFALPMLYIISGNSKNNNIRNIMVKLNKYYPNSYNKYVELSKKSKKCNNNSNCQVEVILDYLEHLTNVTSK